MAQSTARTLRWDLKAAGIPYEVDGKRFDFHALRGAYISRLERSGASVKTLQTLARHTDPRLRLKRYARLRIHGEALAVESMPSLIPHDSTPSELRATGTDNARPVDADGAQQCQQCAQQLGRENVRSGATPCVDAGAPGATGGVRKSLQSREQSDGLPHNAAACNERPQGDSNPCRRLEKPVS